MLEQAVAVETERARHPRELILKTAGGETLQSGLEMKHQHQSSKLDTAMPCTTDPSVRFVELLVALTGVRRAQWICSKSDPGFIFCLLDGEDVVAFETMGGPNGDDYVAPDEELAGIVAHHSNTTYLWLPLLPGWRELLKLLRRSRDDEAQWYGCKRLAREAPVAALEKRLRRRRSGMAVRKRVQRRR